MISSAAAITVARRYGLTADDLLHAEAREPLDDQPQAAVGQLEHLVDVGGGADREQVGLAGLLDRRVALGEDGDQLPAADGIVDQADGAFAGHRERHERVREEDRVAQREDREFGGIESARSPSADSSNVGASGSSLIARHSVDLDWAGRPAAWSGRRGGTRADAARARRRRNRVQLDMSKNSAEDDWRCDAIRSRCWAFSRASSQSRQRTAKGSARSRGCAISSPHSKQLP